MLHKKTILLALASILLLGTTTIFAASGPLTVPIGGNFTDATGGTGTFTGQFALVQFASENSQLVAK